MTPDLVNWQEWMRDYAAEPGYPFVARAFDWLIAQEKAAAVWISGSRATRTADAHSDTDIRVYAPGWTETDLAAWLRAVDPEQRGLVRLSKLGPSVFNYECLFRGSVVIDLLVLAGDPPVLAFDSVVFKLLQPLKRQPALLVIKEAPLTPDDLRNLMEGVLIDQQKFKKLAARHDPLAALFLVEAQRFALLRLAYIAARGVDCGPKPQHTLASLKLVRDTILREGPPPIVAVARDLEQAGDLTETVARLTASIPPLFDALRTRFPALPAAAAGQL